MRSGSILAGTLACAALAATLVATTANAVTPTATTPITAGAWANWSVSGATATATFAGTAFPTASITSTGQSLSTASGASTYLGTRTPIGAVYGSSVNRPYLSAGFSSTPATVTITFAATPTPGTWAFALGDVDAERVTISARDAAGQPLDVSVWHRGSFNNGAGTDAPTWTSPDLIGGNADTSGASAWFQPTQPVKTITLTHTRLPVGGIPSYQLWLVAEPGIGSTVVPTVAPVPAGPPVTPVPAGCLNAPALVNGDFEQPVVSRGTFALLTAAQLPGWNTTAPDGFMELWPNGFLGFNSPSGTQILELNAARPGVLYQDVATEPGQVLLWSLMHRARGFTGPGDTMSVELGAPGAPSTVATFTTPSAAAWVRRSGTYTVPAGQTTTRLSFVTGTTNSGGPLGGPFQGNLLDDVYLTLPPCAPAYAIAAGTPPIPPTPVEVPVPFNATPIPAVPAGPTTLAIPAITGGVSTITGAQQPQNGTITATPAQVVYTPDPGYVGPDTVVVETTTASGVRSTIATAIDVSTAAEAQPPVSICTSDTTALANGSLEEPVIPARTFRQLREDRVPGWSTTAPDRLIELWSTGFQGVLAPVGAQFAEINATTDAELYQTVETVPGQRLTWSLLHRARGGGAAGDTMSVNIGPPDARPNSTTTFTDRLADGWVRHTGTYVVPAGQRETRFGFESGRTASGNRSIGNFLDDIYFTRTECLPAEALEPAVQPPAVTPVSPARTPIVAPDSPTTLPIVPPGSGSISGVTPPSHGTAVPAGGDVVYTPTPGYVGPDSFTVEVTSSTGEVRQQTVSLLVGIEQVPSVDLPLPVRLEPGQNTLLPEPVVTNAGQVIALAVRCTLRSRTTAAGDVPLCTVSRADGATYVSVVGGVPVVVEVVASAPQTGRYLPYQESRTYRVR